MSRSIDAGSTQPAALEPYVYSELPTENSIRLIQIAPDESKRQGFTLQAAAQNVSYLWTMRLRSGRSRTRAARPTLTTALTVSQPPRPDTSRLNAKAGRRGLEVRPLSGETLFDFLTQVKDDMMHVSGPPQQHRTRPRRDDDHDRNNDTTASSPRHRLLFLRQPLEPVGRCIAYHAVTTTTTSHQDGMPSTDPDTLDKLRSKSAHPGAAGGHGHGDPFITLGDAHVLAMSAQEGFVSQLTDDPVSKIVRETHLHGVMYGSMMTKDVIDSFRPVVLH
ncbi:hypothetical protein CTA1_2715 [Colletotrichum tanaceti]|uniref:Uncharacterized protein n=1 Tax=Colletotrichum tanaceti TaxID=1306861 RepID=A0A4U6X7J3_9PEZI|nr:hypothetical protein CTA1_2715 [Colletotrichum tanaceti]